MKLLSKKRSRSKQSSRHKKLKSENTMQQPSPQNMPPGMQPGLAHPAQQMIGDKLDNISKVKSLIGPLRESLKNLFNSAAQLLSQNNYICNG